MARMFTTTTVVVRGDVILEIDGTLVSYEGTEEVEMEKDEYQSLLTGNDARVDVEVGEKISGPVNSYSSITISVRVSLTCEQSEASIKKAAAAATKLAAGQLTRTVRPISSLLLKHIEMLNG